MSTLPFIMKRVGFFFVNKKLQMIERDHNDAKALHFVNYHLKY